YNKVTKVLRFSYNFTPAVLFTYIYYYFITLLLFSLFIKLYIIYFKGFLISYLQIYILKCIPCFILYFMLAFSIMHLTLMPRLV
ncbi:uncharacterized protein FOBCDRAFT_141536, partial [Fusarium oxysporum Fo47]|uniref:uncharacterized protein n=1 Tax=Fusarium oxysporum Fo47 TaxID=660027 RepID=UPI002869D929